MAETGTTPSASRERQPNGPHRDERSGNKHERSGNKRGSRKDQDDIPPWRTEGLPDEPEPPKPNWGRILIFVALGWLLLFALTSTQDQFASQVQTIPYSEFT